ncbi:hypothetical protein PG987_011453 [Apiospora arundinis]
MNPSDSSKENLSKTKVKQLVGSKSDAKKNNKSRSKEHTYICKRCHTSVQECPTNLDPSYDTAPDPGYLCNFCGKLGVHLGTLCPHNNEKWSLTTQRKEHVTKSISEHPEIRNTRRERSNIQLRLPIRQHSDSYRPQSSSRDRDEVADRYRPSYRDRSLSPFREPSTLLATPVNETRRSAKRGG